MKLNMVTARCTKCGQSREMTANQAMEWLSSDPSNPHDCWVPKNALKDVVDCFWCGKRFNYGDFESLGQHVRECTANGKRI